MNEKQEKQNRKINVREHTRVLSNGETDISKHTRDIENRKASLGSDKTLIDDEYLKGRRSEKFQDIGEKFYGAKKDIWAEKRLFNLDDITKLEENTADALQYITKDKIVEPIDENAELMIGVTPGTIYLKKYLYNSLNNKPKINSKEAREFFFTESRNVFESLKEIKTIDELKDFQSHYGRKLYYDRNIRKEFYSARMGATFFGMITRTSQTSVEKMTIARNIDENKQGLEEVNRLLEKKKLDENKDTDKIEPYKKPYLDDIERVGGIPVKNIKPEFLIKELGLKGVEYGNYVNDEEAKQNIKYFVASMYDLEDAIGLDIAKLNKEGNLGIAFGSRGSGKASAHFEPYRDVINLTKSKGDGSLAHEYGHFIDHYLKKKFGNPENNVGEKAIHLTSDYEQPKNMVQKAMANVMKSIYEGSSKMKIRYQKPTSFKPTVTFEYKVKEKLAKGQTLNQIWQEEITKYNESYERKKKIITDYYNPTDKNRIYTLSPDRVNEELRKERIKHTKSVNELGKLFAYMSPEGNIVLDVPTDRSEYYTISSRQGSGDYWTKPTELFARAFESYVTDKLNEKSRRNTYLSAGNGDSSMTFEHAKTFNFPYPVDEERKRINNAMDQLMKTIYVENSNLQGVRN